MFVKLTRINEKFNEKELVVNTEEIAFVTETEPRINYNNPVEFGEEEFENPVTGETETRKVPTKYEEVPTYLIAFKNGKNPQKVDKANYDKIVAILTANTVYDK